MEANINLYFDRPYIDIQMSKDVYNLQIDSIKIYPNFIDEQKK